MRPPDARDGMRGPPRAYAPSVPEVPPFRSARLIPRLNILAVALSLSACTAAVFGVLVPDVPSAATGGPTLFAGLRWAWLLRTSRTAFGTKVRVGWLASVPLAILNTAAACAWAAAARGATWATVMGNAPSAFLFIAVFGSIVWVPALLCTLACFGLPIAWAQSLAKKGLSGAERGEAIVAGACATLSTLALALMTRAPPFHDRPPTLWVGLGGAVLGLVAATLAVRRERERARFVECVARGEVVGYRVDETSEGRALVRVSEQGTVAYRVADYREAVCFLDENGRATETRHTH